MRILGRETVEVRVVVDEAAVERRFENVPVDVVGAAPGTKVNPQTINLVLSGPPRLIDRLTPDQIHLVADVSRLAPDTTQAEVPIEAEVRRNPDRRAFARGGQVDEPPPCQGIAVRTQEPLMKRLFGTDGIRAIAGEPPLDPPTVRKFGAALADVLKCQGAGGGGCRVVIGRDTRESGRWLSDAVVAGLASRNVEATDAGVISTPGLAHVLQVGRFDAGVMISASHNPFQDNGLKAFGPQGAKLSDDTEREIEKLILDDGLADPGEGNGQVKADAELVREYLGHLAELVAPPGCLQGMRLVLDCANGSASGIAPEIFRGQGAIVETIGTDPNGRNINLDCGSLHLDSLARAVVDAGADAGLAFDGDADRCLAVDRKGRVVDGDCILYITGRRLKREGRLRERRARRHDHEQLLARGTARRGRDPAASSPGRGQVRAGEDERRGPRPGRRAVGARHLPRPCLDG